MKSPITTHILDTMSGKPAAGVSVKLELLESGARWKELATAATNADGRVMDLLPETTRLVAGQYRLTFDTGTYFQLSRIETFYPKVVVNFEVKDPVAHYHVPLLLSSFGYSTYRGS
jgi:5-hydroxyisourate hydrolase